MKWYKSDKGFMMVSVILLLAITSVIALMALHVYQTGHNETTRVESLTQARYLAESGARTVASYLINNPEQLPNLIGTSDPIKFDTTSDYAIVTVSEDTDNVYIQSVGNIFKGRAYIKSLELVLEKQQGLSLDFALYVEENLHIKNNIDVIGDVAMKGDNSNYTQENSAEITGDLSFNVEFDFEVPDFPTYPTGLTNRSTEKPSNLIANSYYTNGVELDRVDFTINVHNDDFIVRMSYLIGKQSEITINRTGTGRVIFYVEDDNAFNLDKCDLNASGDHDDLIIYYESSSNDFVIQNGTDLKADLFVENASKVDIKSGTTRYDGHLVYEGSGEVIVENNAGWSNGLLYAPNADVTFKNNTTLHGVAIAKNLLLENHAYVEYSEIDDSNLIEGTSLELNMNYWRK